MIIFKLFFIKTQISDKTLCLMRTLRDSDLFLKLTQALSVSSSHCLLKYRIKENCTFIKIASTALNTIGWIIISFTRPMCSVLQTESYLAFVTQYIACRLSVFWKWIKNNWLLPFLQCQRLPENEERFSLVPWRMPKKNLLNSFPPRSNENRVSTNDFGLLFWHVPVVSEHTPRKQFSCRTYCHWSLEYIAKTFLRPPLPFFQYVFS